MLTTSSVITAGSAAVELHGVEAMGDGGHEGRGKAPISARPQLLWGRRANQHPGRLAPPGFYRAYVGSEESKAILLRSLYLSTQCLPIQPHHNNYSPPPLPSTASALLPPVRGRSSPTTHNAAVTHARPARAPRQPQHHHPLSVHLDAAETPPPPFPRCRHPARRCKKAPEHRRRCCRRPRARTPATRARLQPRGPPPCPAIEALPLARHGPLVCRHDGR